MLLEIVTRHIQGRPAMLAANMAVAEQLAAAAGVPTPRFAVVEHLDEARALARIDATDLSADALVS